MLTTRIKIISQTLFFLSFLIVSPDENLEIEVAALLTSRWTPNFPCKELLAESSFDNAYV